MAPTTITLELTTDERDNIADAIDAQVTNLERRANDKRTPKALKAPLTTAAADSAALAAKVRGVAA